MAVAAKSDPLPFRLPPPRTPDRPVRLVAMLWPVWYGLTRLLGLPSLTFTSIMLVAGVYALIVAGSSKDSGENPTPVARLLLLLACYGCFALAMTRTHVVGTTFERTVSLTANIAFPLLFFAAAAYGRNLAQSIYLQRALLWSIPIYIGTDIILDGSVLQLLLSGMMRSERLYETAFMNGSNTISAVSGLSLIISLHKYRTGELRSISLLLIIFSAIVIILCDSRAIIISAVGVSSFYLLLPTTWLVRGAYLTLSLTIVSAPLLLAVFGVLSDSWVGEAFARDGALGTRLGLGTGRTVLWDAVLQNLGRLSPEHFTGYGYGSAAQAGAEAAFNYIFYSEYAELRQPLSPTLHNMTLQMIFDVGYLGLLVYILVFFSAIRILAKDRYDPHRHTVLSIFIYVIISGFTESVGTIYHFEIFVFMMALCSNVLLRGKPASINAPGIIDGRSK